MKKNIPVILLTTVMVLMAHAAARAGEALDTPEARLVDRVEARINYTHLGNAFQYETGLGRVEVEAAGGSAAVSARLGKHVEVAYEHVDYDVDSTFAGAVAGSADTDAHQVSVKIVWTANVKRGKKDAARAENPKVAYTKDPRRPQYKLRPHEIRFGVQYKYLDNKEIEGIHFADVFAATSLGTVEATAGVSSYFGSGVDDRAGGFVNFSYNAGGRVELFVEYSGADYLKAVQGFLIAPTAKNIGTINVDNMPRDAVSFGVKVKKDWGGSAKVSVYDVNNQMKPVVEFGFSF